MWFNYGCKFRPHTTGNHGSLRSFPSDAFQNQFDKEQIKSHSQLFHIPKIQQCQNLLLISSFYDITLLYIITLQCRYTGMTRYTFSHPP